MIGLEIRLNGRLLCVAGVPEDDVTACVELVGWHLPSGLRPPSTLTVFAIKDFVKLEWPGAESLVPGDEIVIRVVEPAQADEPSRAKRKDADAEEAQDRLRYEDLKRKYDPDNSGKRRR
jgi:hypothetical protein